MKAYKGFSKDMTCRGFQYEEGKTYKTDHAKLCSEGFHACTDPLDIFTYYPPGEDCVYHEVEMSGELDTVNLYEVARQDTKVCCTNITIGKQLTYNDIYNLHYELVKNTKKNDSFLLSRSPSGSKIVIEDHTYADLDGTDDVRAVAGCYNAIDMNYGCSLTAEDCNTINANYNGNVCIGNSNFVFTDRQSVITAHKNNCIMAGNSCRIIAGDGSAVTAGDDSVVIAGGIVSVGFKSCATAYGIVPKISGALGSTLILLKIRFACSRPGNELITKTVAVDGKTVIPHRWYTIDDEGNLIETTCAMT